MLRDVTWLSSCTLVEKKNISLMENHMYPLIKKTRFWFSSKGYTEVGTLSVLYCWQVGLLQQNDFHISRCVVSMTAASATSSRLAPTQRLDRLRRSAVPFVQLSKNKNNVFFNFTTQTFKSIQYLENGREMKLSIKTNEHLQMIKKSSANITLKH